MNRRELLAAFTAVPVASLPSALRVSRADLKPNDTLIIECDGPMPQETASLIKHIIEDTFPGHKCLVLTDGLRFKVAGSQG